MGVRGEILDGGFRNEVETVSSFDRVMMTYGAETWGWVEQEELQKLITKYWRWVLGVKWNVPSYIIQEEVDEEMLWAKTWGRAYKYEKN